MEVIIRVYVIVLMAICVVSVGIAKERVAELETQKESNTSTKEIIKNNVCIVKDCFD